jgi:hypothetical protein
MDFVEQYSGCFVSRRIKIYTGHEKPLVCSLIQRTNLKAMRLIQVITHSNTSSTARCQSNPVFASQSAEENVISTVIKLRLGIKGR